MKVRWKSDSLRLRITPTELKDLHGGKQISERLNLTGGTVWEVAIFPNADSSAQNERTRLLVHRLISGRHSAVGDLADFQGASDEHTEIRT